MWKVYKHLDKNGDGTIGYNEFCELCEERWRGLDPFKHAGGDTHDKNKDDSTVTRDLQVEDFENMNIKRMLKLSNFRK